MKAACAVAVMTLARALHEVLGPACAGLVSSAGSAIGAAGRTLGDLLRGITGY